MILSFEIHGFKSIARAEAQPGGHSITISGRNGAGKSTLTEALLWGLGDDAGGEVVRDGADKATVRMTIDSTGGKLAITASKTKAGKRTIKVEDVIADGEPKRAPYREPSALLAQFRRGIARRAFSQLDEKARLATLLSLSPGLDCSALDAERAAVYAERTKVGNVADDLEAQARGVVVPDAVEAIGEERLADVIDVAEIAARKGEVERVKAANERERSRLAAVVQCRVTAVHQLDDALADLERAREALRRAEENEERARAECAVADEKADAATEALAALVDPSTEEIDRQIAEARAKNAAARAEAEAHNRAVRAAAAANVARVAKVAEQESVAARAAEKRAAYKAATERIATIDRDRAAKIAAAACPVEGLAITPAGVVYPGGNGPVLVDALSTGERLTLDVEVAAALGIRAIPVPAWGELDRAHRQRLDALADKRRVMLLRELTTLDGDLCIVVEDGDTTTDNESLDL